MGRRRHPSRQAIEPPLRIIQPKLTMSARPTFDSIDAYIAAAAPQVRDILTKIRATAAKAVPGAEECISYQMPALRHHGKVFFYFAAFKKHIGVYPPVKDAAMVAELQPWRGPKGNLQFPLDAAMPYALIGRVAAALAQEYASAPTPRKVATKRA